jgi:hypothetical protein
MKLRSLKFFFCTDIKKTATKTKTFSINPMKKDPFKVIDEKKPIINPKQHKIKLPRIKKDIEIDPFLTRVEQNKQEFEEKKKSNLLEVYASTYYKLSLSKEFDLFDLRNLFYSYLFVKQRNGHIYLNIDDSHEEV